jgi:ubiquinone/menaquinone biosynthesis C-methylase UbiE
MALLRALDISESDAVLDIGSGLGGPARAAVRAFGCTVKGIDLTEEFVTVANTLSGWPGVSLADRVSCEVGDATSLSTVPDASIDKAMMLHVGMNIADKRALAAEIARVLKPGGKLALFDMMRGKAGGDLVFPLPFAACAEDCPGVEPPEVYSAAMRAAGLVLESEEDKSEYCLATLKKMPRACISISALCWQPCALRCAAATRATAYSMNGAGCWRCLP